MQHHVVSCLHYVSVRKLYCAHYAILTELLGPDIVGMEWLA